MSIATGFVAILVLLGLLLIRIPIAIALILVAFGGVASMIGVQSAMSLLAAGPYDFAASWTLSAVPMFLLMGFVAYHSGMTSGLFAAASIFLRRIPGGLALSSIVACSGFASVCGSSIACAAAMGRIAIPEMVKSGYRSGFACGTVAAGGTIGALIPPSILMIIYGVFAQASVAKIFLGGIVVGALTALSYAIVIFLVAMYSPSTIPRRARDHVEAPGATVEALRGVWPIMVLVVITFGGLFLGVFTATEAGAVGAATSTFLALITGRLTRSVIASAFVETLSTTASLFIIAIGASLFTRFLGLSGFSSYLTSFVTSQDLSTTSVLIAIIVIYLALGMFMEPFGAMLVTLPVFLPVVESHGISLIWFGVLVVKLLEVGMVTPPLGMNIFVIKSIAPKDISLGRIFRGASIYLMADAAVIATMCAFPSIVVVLSNISA